VSDPALERCLLTGRERGLPRAFPAAWVGDRERLVVAERGRVEVGAFLVEERRVEPARERRRDPELVAGGAQILPFTG